MQRDTIATLDWPRNDSFNSEKCDLGGMTISEAWWPSIDQSSTDAAASIILILSDINMPGMTDLELLPKAKAARPDDPMIMITAYGDAETKRKALENGADALLTRPIDFEMQIDTRVEHAA